MLSGHVCRCLVCVFLSHLFVVSLQTFRRTAPFGMVLDMTTVEAPSIIHYHSAGVTEGGKRWPFCCLTSFYQRLSRDSRLYHLGDRLWDAPPHLLCPDCNIESIGLCGDR